MVFTDASLAVLRTRESYRTVSGIATKPPRGG